MNCLPVLYGLKLVAIGNAEVNGKEQVDNNHTFHV
jgi:hypothetical protein